jgi:hypothetical protein
MEQINLLNVFIASPGDVTAEREIVREVCTEMSESAFCQTGGFSFRPIGWEDEIPAAGRPQEIINKLMDECDIFICMFHKRFGTPSGKESSGTLEEFLRAYDSWKNLEKPHIMFYFKDIVVTPGLRHDPQFNEVMDLRDRIEREGLLLYDTFDNEENFRKKFKKHLEKWLAKYVKEINQQRLEKDKKKHLLHKLP